MSKRSKKLGTIVAGLSAAAIALTGCASNGDGSASADDAVFVTVIGSNPAHLNPQLSTDVSTGIVAAAIFDTLIEVDRDAALHPSLATAWEGNEDATEFSITLEEGVTWHDGEPFTSADVKFNLEEIVPLHPLGSFAKKISEIRTPDETTVEVSLAEPFAPFMASMGTHRMLPAHLYEGTDIVTNEANSAPVGTGPFKFDEFLPGDRVSVVKNDDYWAESGDIQRVIFKIMPDTNARMLAMQSGEIDRIPASFIETAQIGTMEKDSNLLFQPSSIQPAVMTVFLNTRQGPLADPAVREAVYTAIDRDSIADNVYSGYAEPSRGPIPASIAWAADPEINYAEQFAFDADAAADMLDAAGYPADANGDRFSLRIAAASGFPTFVGTAEVIKSNLEAIGVSVNMEIDDLSIFVDKAYKNYDFDMAVMNFGSYEDPSLGVSRLYVCNPNNVAFANPTGICDAQIDEAFQQAAMINDRDERAKLFSVAEKRAAEVLGTLPLVTEAPVNVIRQDRWSGVEAFNNYMWEDWSALSVKG